MRAFQFIVVVVTTAVGGKKEKIQKTLKKHNAVMLTVAPHRPRDQRREGRLRPVARRRSSVEMETMYEVSSSEAESEATATRATELPRLISEKTDVTMKLMKIALRGTSQPG